MHCLPKISCLTWQGPVRATRRSQLEAKAEVVVEKVRLKEYRICCLVLKKVDSTGAATNNSSSDFKIQILIKSFFCIKSQTLQFPKRDILNILFSPTTIQNPKDQEQKNKNLSLLAKGFNLVNVCAMQRVGQSNTCRHTFLVVYLVTGTTYFYCLPNNRRGARVGLLIT